MQTSHHLKMPEMYINLNTPNDNAGAPRGYTVLRLEVITRCDGSKRSLSYQPPGWILSILIFDLLVTSVPNFLSHSLCDQHLEMLSGFAQDNITK